MWEALREFLLSSLSFVAVFIWGCGAGEGKDRVLSGIYYVMLIELVT